MLYTLFEYPAARFVVRLHEPIRRSGDYEVVLPEIA